jgi:D-amino-acid dehydrogenase
LNREKSDILIVGGGIIGLMCAYYLVKEGKSVVIINKGNAQQACSHGNCGYQTTSRALPLNKPKLIMRSLKWMLQKDSPFYIRPQFDIRFISWMLTFAANAYKPKVIERSMLGRYNLLVSSKALYQELFEAEKIQCNWSPNGVLFVYKREKYFEEYKKKIELLQEIGLSPQPFAGTDLQKKEPALKKDIFGAWFYEVDASLKPDELISETQKLLKQKGVEFIDLCEVTAFNEEGSTIKSVVTDKGTFKADEIVIATGAWSTLLEKSLYLKIPIVPGKGYSITMKSPKISPKIPCIFEERKVVATPWNGSYRLGGTMEFAGYSTEMNQVRLQNLKNVTKEYLIDPYTDDVTEEWSGWRPMTNDGLPIIGKSPIHKNVTLACGHNMLGLSMAPGTGKLVAELILEKPTHLGASVYAITRFNQGL